MSLQSLRLWLRLFIVNDLATLLVLFVWLVINIAIFFAQFVRYRRLPAHYYLRALIFDGLSVARASATCLNFNCFLILLPVCRNLLALVRHLLPKCITKSRFRRFTIRLFDQHIGFHRCVGYAICFWSVLHAGAHIYNYERFVAVHSEYLTLPAALNLLSARSNQSQINPLNQAESKTLGVGVLFRTTAGITGVLLVLCLMIMLSSSTALIRRSFYEIFWFTHHLFIVFFVGLIIHGLQGIVKSQVNVNEHNPNICASRYRDWGIDQQCLVYPRFKGSRGSSWMWVCGPLRSLCHRKTAPGGPTSSTSGDHRRHSARIERYRDSLPKGPDDHTTARSIHLFEMLLHRHARVASIHGHIRTRGELRQRARASRGQLDEGSGEEIRNFSTRHTEITCRRALR